MKQRIKEWETKYDDGSLMCHGLLITVILGSLFTAALLAAAALGVLMFVATGVPWNADTIGWKLAGVLAIIPLTALLILKVRKNRQA